MKKMKIFSPLMLALSSAFKWPEAYEQKTYAPSRWPGLAPKRIKRLNRCNNAKRNVPHQGKQEMARRVRQAANKKNHTVSA